jgi:signal transduction histidine kinase
MKPKELNLISGISLVLLFLISGALLSTIINFSTKEFQTPLCVFAIVLITLVYELIKKNTQKFSSNKPLSTSYSSEKLLNELGDITNSTLSLKVLTQKTLKTILKALHISEGAFLLIDHQTNKIVAQQQGYQSTPELSIENIEVLKDIAKDGVLFIKNLKNDETKKLFIDQKIIVAIPLFVSNTTHGLLILGKKTSRKKYTNQDLKVLDVFESQISMAIQNSLDYEKIRQFNNILKNKVDEATEKLQKANKKLIHLDKLKDEFVYVATHELKNPVTAMKGYLSMIDEGSFGKIPEKLQDPLFQINQSNQHLVKLVNNLLQIARTEVQPLSVDVTKVNICNIIEKIISGVQPLADQKKIIINYVCLEKEILVKADPERLEEVFNNLITNAIKYSNKGTITIKYSVEDDQVITHIKDEGIGIAKKDQKKIFTRFFRVEEQAAKGIPGSGLGLFIVRQLLEKMGGKIWFTSKLGKGSIFSFSLPKAD